MVGRLLLTQFINILKIHHRAIGDPNPHVQEHVWRTHKDKTIIAFDINQLRLAVRDRLCEFKRSGSMSVAHITLEDATVTG